MIKRLACSNCGDRIGVYEPTVLIGPEGRRVTSQARETDLALADGSVFHARCAPAELPTPSANRSSTRPDAAPAFGLRATAQ